MLFDLEEGRVESCALEVSSAIWVKEAKRGRGGRGRRTVERLGTVESDEGNRGERVAENDRVVGRGGRGEVAHEEAGSLASGAEGEHLSNECGERERVRVEQPDGNVPRLE